MIDIFTNYRQSFKKKIITLCIWLIIVFIFASTYTQHVLYDSNQNTKFLYGMKDAGVGLLGEDWLANSVDPLPLFSFLIRITYSVLNEYFIYLYFIILLGIYLYSLLGIAHELQEDKKSHPVLFGTFLILLVLHAKIVKKLFGISFLTSGVAGQTILTGQTITGDYFQTSVFGVLLVLSIFLFLRKKYYGAVISIGLSCLFHSAYLVSAGLLTISYMLVIFLETRKIIKPLVLGLIALAMVAPVILYNRIVLSSTSAEIWNRAMEIIIYKRIPHHSLPFVWFNFINVIQIALICCAIYLIRKTRLFLILLIPFMAGVVLTLLQIILNSNFFAFLEPWRVSALLVPVSVVIIIQRSCYFLFNKFKSTIQKYGKIIKITGIVITAGLVLGGIFLQYYFFRQYYSRKSTPLAEYVKQNKVSGDVYLIPSGDNEFERFRLFTGAPVFITWKSHPYKDIEVLEWYKRNELATSFYQSSGEKICQNLKAITGNYHITHLVMDKKKNLLKCDNLKIIYEDKNYILYNLIQ